jgi:hypothetical protein
MNEGALIDVLLTRALEASDREQRIVSDSLRRRAAEFAQSELGRRTTGGEESPRSRAAATAG